MCTERQLRSHAARHLSCLALCPPPQAFRLGRYTVHFHMHGDLAFQSYLRGCAIHHTYNRAVTIHGSHRVILQDNVAYFAMGHTFFLEVLLTLYGRATANSPGLPCRASVKYVLFLFLARRTALSLAT